MTFFFIASAVKVVVVFTAVMVGVALLTWLERRVCAWIQDRLGPNRVGVEGLLQPAADGLKNILKEETLPRHADRWLFLLAPAIAFIPALLTIAGNVTLSDVVARQQTSPCTWNVFPLSLAFLIFIVAAFAETNRLPFDLPEAEGELIAGYHTEYSAMKFSMFYIAEYASMVTASALA